MKTVGQILNEVFNHPWSYTWHEQNSKNQKENMKNDPAFKGHDITNVKVHTIEGNNGHLTSYVRNGLLEVHHTAINDDSGVLQKKSNKPNPRFYSTIIHHYQKHGLDKGRTVRVVAKKDSELDKRYSSLIPKLAKVHDYELTHGEEKLGDHTMHTIEVRPRQHPIAEAIDNCLRMSIQQEKDKHEQ